MKLFDRPIVGWRLVITPRGDNRWLPVYSKYRFRREVRLGMTLTTVFVLVFTLGWLTQPHPACLDIYRTAHPQICQAKIGVLP